MVISDGKLCDSVYLPLKEKLMPVLQSELLFSQVYRLVCGSVTTSGILVAISESHLRQENENSSWHTLEEVFVSAC